MVALPDQQETDAYAARHGLIGWPRTKVIERMLADEKRRRAAPDLDSVIDADAFAAGLRRLQDAADEAGVRPDVLAAAVPAATRVILRHSLYNPDKDFR